MGTLPAFKIGSCRSAMALAIWYFCREQSNRPRKNWSMSSSLQPAARLSWMRRTGRTPVILPQGGRMPVHARSRSYVRLASANSGVSISGRRARAVLLFPRSRTMAQRPSGFFSAQTQSSPSSGAVRVRGAMG